MSLFNYFEKIFNVKNTVNNIKAQNLLKNLQWAVTLPVYKKNCLEHMGYKTTYCNIFSYDFLDSRCTRVWTVNPFNQSQSYNMGQEIKIYDYDIRSILTNNDVNMIIDTPIQNAYAKGLEAVKNGIIKELTPAQAQARANEGVPIMVISVTCYHVAIVAPTFKPYDENLGCYLGNAGAYNDMMYMSDKRTYGAYDWKSPEIKYWEFPVYNT